MGTQMSPGSQWEVSCDKCGPIRSRQTVSIQIRTVLDQIPDTGRQSSHLCRPLTWDSVTSQFCIISQIKVDIFERVMFEFSARQILTKDADKWGMFVRSLPDTQPIRGQGCDTSSQSEGQDQASASSSSIHYFILMMLEGCWGKKLNNYWEWSTPASLRAALKPKMEHLMIVSPSHRNFLPPL